MSSSTFDLDERRLENEVRRRNARIVLLQLPEGLKPYGPKLVAVVEGAGAIGIVSGDPCYGACDLALVEAERLGADLIVHYGHNEMLKQTAHSAIYLEARAKVSVARAVEKAVPLLEKWTRIGLATTVQHVHKLEEARKVLVDAGKSVAIGDAGRLTYAGQVYGCDYSNAKAVAEDVDAFLFVGGGKFHAIGLALAVAKPTIVADPYEKRAYTVEKEAARMLRTRWASIHKATQAVRVGILIGLKPGQKRLDRALEMKRLVEQSGKQATLLALKEITSEALMQFPTMEAFINTACPRLSLDRWEEVDKPLLTPDEALVALGKLQWEELCRKGWFEN